MSKEAALLPYDSAEFYQSLPKKRMAAGVLLTNDQGDILLIKPTYKESWLIPGGITEDNESPKETALRETIEEIGISITVGRLLCMDYCSAKEQVTESLQFIFQAQEWSGDIKAQEEEIAEIKFLPMDEAVKLVSPGLAKRLQFAFKAHQENTTYYLENGQHPLY